MQLKGLAERQIKDHNVCFEAQDFNDQEMVMVNMNMALVSDGVNDQSMTTFAK